VRSIHSIEVTPEAIDSVHLVGNNPSPPDFAFLGDLCVSVVNAFALFCGAFPASDAVSDRQSLEFFRVLSAIRG
jgi:hypothetical protein